MTPEKEILIKMYTSTGTQLQITFYMLKLSRGGDAKCKGTSKETVFLCLYSGISKTQLPHSL